MLRVYLIAEEKILFLKPEQEKDKTYFTDKEVRKHFILKKSFSLQPGGPNFLFACETFMRINLLFVNGSL